jgi:parvulin-like peptidyl-prolyl isomerase
VLHERTGIMNRHSCIFVSFLVSLGIAEPAAAEPGPPAEGAAGSAVAATVGDEPINVAEALRWQDEVAAEKKLQGKMPPEAQAQLLEAVINQRLVLAYARREGEFPSDEDLAKAKQKLKVRMDAQGRKVSETFKSESMTPADLERRVAWHLVWDRYLARYCTQKRRETWFKSHHAEVDGTELVVSHILLRPAAGAGSKDYGALAKRAESIRAEIESGKLDFAAAAEKYSDGPSAKQGGRLGKIGRHGPMEEVFSRAAFQLQAGEISPPVQTQFGVHLIRCEEVLPGKKTAADLTAVIDGALSKELLEKIARIQREKTPVKYTPAWPHFKPGTRELDK